MKAYVILDSIGRLVYLSVFSNEKDAVELANGMKNYKVTPVLLDPLVIPEDQQ